MGLFSRKSKKKQDTGEPVWQDNPLYEQEPPQRTSTANVPMRDLYDELSASKKGGSEHQHAGGLASHLTILEQGDLKNTDASGFFKEAEVFTYHEDKEVVMFELMERARKRSPISDSLYEKAKERMSVATSGNLACVEIPSLANNLKNMDEMTTVPAFASYVNSLCALANSYDTTRYNVRTRGLLNVNLKDGESINLSSRNVATSRMAELLGAGDVVAKSETVEMIEPGKTTGRIGNLMQKAEGKASGSGLYYRSD